MSVSEDVRRVECADQVECCRIYGSFGQLGRKCRGLFSYPITARWRTGGKVLAGYQYYESFSLNGYTLGSCGGPVFGVGTSMTFRANYNFDLRFQTTYYLQPPMVRESRQHLNTLTLGLSANIAF